MKTKREEERRKTTWIAAAVAVAVTTIVLLALPRSLDETAPPPAAPEIARPAPRLPIDLGPPPVIEAEPPPALAEEPAPPPREDAKPQPPRAVARAREEKPLEPPAEEPPIPEPAPATPPVEAAAELELEQAEPPPPPAEEPAKIDRAARLAELLKPTNTVEIVYTEKLAGLTTNELQLLVDGEEYSRAESSAALATDRGYVLFLGELPVGRHELLLRVKLTPDAKVFKYVEHYTFTLVHRGTLLFAPGKTRLDFETVRTGDITEDWEDKVDLRVEVTTEAPGEV